jgi:hypothetical protein
MTWTMTMRVRMDAIEGAILDQTMSRGSGAGYVIIWEGPCA